MGYLTDFNQICVMGAFCLCLYRECCCKLLVWHRGGSEAGFSCCRIANGQHSALLCPRFHFFIIFAQSQKVSENTAVMG